MKRVEGLVLLLLLAGTMIVAQTPDGGAVSRGPYQQAMAPVGAGERTDVLTGQASESRAIASPVDENPVAEVRSDHLWALAPFVNWGTGVGDRSDYKFLWAGFHLSKVMFRPLHAGILSGQFEFGGEIMPLWQAYTPPPHSQAYTCETPQGAFYTCNLPFGGGTFRGVSIEPVIFRWNFLTKSRRIQPWFQGAGGLIYTTHKFPPNLMSNNNPANGPIIDGGTSVWNFTPQGGFGVHYFLKSKRSIDLGINAVHISSASLGDRNPGVNASIQIQAGYTFWK